MSSRNLTGNNVSKMMKYKEIIQQKEQRYLNSSYRLNRC